MSGDGNETKPGYFRRAPRGHLQLDVDELPEPILPPSPYTELREHVSQLHHDVRQLRAQQQAATDAIWKVQAQQSNTDSKVNGLIVAINDLKLAQSTHNVSMLRWQRLGAITTVSLVLAILVVLLLRMYGVIGL